MAKKSETKNAMVLPELTYKQVEFGFKIPIQIGEIKTNELVLVRVYSQTPTEDKPKTYSWETEHYETENITYMGMDINGYENFKKLKEFHKTLGIDIQLLISKKLNEVLNDTNIDEIIKHLGFDKFYE